MCVCEMGERERDGETGRGREEQEGRQGRRERLRGGERDSLAKVGLA